MVLLFALLCSIILTETLAFPRGWKAAFARRGHPEATPAPGSNLPDWSYGIIIDSGSTGSRLFLFKWRKESENKIVDMQPALDAEGKPVVKKVYPGLSTFGDSPNGAADYIKPLLDYAVEYVPEAQRPSTPISLFATAGMRLLSPSAQEAVLNNLRTKLPLMTPMKVIPENIKVIDGKWEGIYAWIAVNYMLGKFDANKSHNDRKATVGMVDMGGASAQVAFEDDKETTSHGEDFETINLGCNDKDETFKYRLFAATFLGYGVNEGLRMYEQHLGDTLLEQKDKKETVAKDPCLPLNLEASATRKDGSQFTRKGLGDWKQCLEQLKKLIAENANTECFKEKCFLGKVVAPKLPLSRMDMYGVSEYWYTLENVLDLGGSYDFSKVAAKSQEFCGLDWSKIHTRFIAKLYPLADETRLREQCFKSAWITAVLHAGFSVDQASNHFQSVLNINGQEVQWAPGAMLLNLKASACKK